MIQAKRASGLSTSAIAPLHFIRSAIRGSMLRVDDDWRPGGKRFHSFLEAFGDRLGLPASSMCDQSPRIRTNIR
jgi:hypothetical protein